MIAERPLRTNGPVLQYVHLNKISISLFTNAGSVIFPISQAEQSAKAVDMSRAVRLLRSLGPAQKI
jgi:hypothetical protein